LPSEEQWDVLVDFVKITMNFERVVLACQGADPRAPPGSIVSLKLWNLAHLLQQHAHPRALSMLNLSNEISREYLTKLRRLFKEYFQTESNSILESDYVIFPLLFDFNTKKRGLELIEKVNSLV
jgi:hypothetical protein